MVRPGCEYAGSDLPGRSSWARGDVSAAATFHLPHLATRTKCADYLNEAIVVEAEKAEKAANPIQLLVTAFRHGTNS